MAARCRQAVERLVLTTLLEQQYREEAGPGPSAQHQVEVSRRLRDLFAVPAGEILAQCLDDRPRAGINSGVSVISSSSFDSRSLPQAQYEQRAGTTARSRGRRSGIGFIASRLRSEAVTLLVLTAATSAADVSSLASDSRSSRCSSI